MSAVETHTTKQFHYFCQVSHMEYWLGKFYVTEVTWTGCHVAFTSQAFRSSIHNTLPWIHQTTLFGSPTLHCVWVSDSIRSCN